MVIFVGDKPSRLNESPMIPFVGTPSWKTLLKWIKTLDVSSYHISNSFSPMDMVEVQCFKKDGNTFIALGNEASDRLAKVGIEHFKLPHPSPRNRKLNDPKFIDSELEKCKDYLKGLVKCV